MLLLLAVGLGACGDDGATDNGSSTAETRTTATSPQATAPSAPEPPADATTPGGAEHSAREQTNGGSEPVRIDAQFTLRGGRLRPRTVSSPAFLAVSVSVRNTDAATRVVVVRVDRDYRMTVTAGRTATRLVPGQRAGTYPVLVDGRRRGALVFGGEPGP